MNLNKRTPNYCVLVNCADGLPGGGDPTGHPERGRSAGRLRGGGGWVREGAVQGDRSAGAHRPLEEGGLSTHHPPRGRHQGETRYPDEGLFTKLRCLDLIEISATSPKTRLYPKEETFVVGVCIGTGFFLA